MTTTIDNRDDLLARTIGRSRLIGVLLLGMMEGKRRLVQSARKSAGACDLPDLGVGDPNAEFMPEPRARQDLAEIVCLADCIGPLPTRDGELVPSSELNARGPFP